MMRKILIFSFVFLTFSQAKSQQDALYSQYMFNPFAINPAYAGSRDALSGVLLFRRQWIGIEGAPATQTFSLHGPIANGKMALGINLMNDVVGPTQNTGLLLTYSYILKLKKAKLAFALRGGSFNSRFNNNLLSFTDGSDRFNNVGIVSSRVPTVDFGTYLYSTNMYAGFSVNHLMENQIKYETLPSDAFVVLKRHYTLSGGWAIPINDKSVFKPSTIIRYVANAPLSYDLNASILFNKIFWLGLSYRSSKSAVLLLEFNIKEFLRIGYSYDRTFTALRRFNSGSHEIMLGFDLNLKKTKSLSPRYL